MKELDYLMPDTQRVLFCLSQVEMIKNFTFVGGSALAYYLRHRLSEDIDLFTWDKSLFEINFSELTKFFRAEQIKIINKTSEQIDVVIDKVKITFFVQQWQELKNRNKLLNYLYIADKATLAVMKINTLFLRATFRDYYDLYVLVKDNHFSLSQLYELATKKIFNLNKTLFQRALIFTDDIIDKNIKHLSPKYNVQLKEIENFFQQEIKKWNKSK